MSAPADSAEGRWLARLRERRREGALHVAALEDVEALIAERDAARAEVARLRHHASGMEDELRYGEEVCATIVDERDAALSQVKAWQAEELSRRTERDAARAEVERLRGERDEQIAEAARERDEALSQVKAWQAEELARRTERDEARAEVELLKDHAAGTLCIRCDLLQVERDAARAEVERLRALLDGYGTGDE